MSKTNSAIKQTRVRFGTERIVLWGNETDTEIRLSKEKLEKAGREVVLQPRPRFDTGMGQCGQLCHCNGNCKNQFASI